MLFGPSACTAAKGTICPPYVENLVTHHMNHHMPFGAGQSYYDPTVNPQHLSKTAIYTVESQKERNNFKFPGFLWLGVSILPPLFTYFLFVFLSNIIAVA
jgi:hypothetical protein